MIEMITTKNHGRNGHFYFPSCNQLILNVKYKFVQCHNTNVPKLLTSAHTHIITLPCTIVGVINQFVL